MASKVPWNRPYSIHSSDKAVTPPEVFKVRFYQLCDRFKNFYHMVLKWATEFRQPSAIDAGRQLFGCHATSIFNAELHAILLALDVARRSKEKHFLLLLDSYSSLGALGGGHFDHNTIYKYIKIYTSVTNSGKTVILRGIPGHAESAEISGNERANGVAKAALSGCHFLQCISPFKISVTDFLPRAKLYLCRQ